MAEAKRVKIFESLEEARNYHKALDNPRYHAYRVSGPRNPACFCVAQNQREAIGYVAERRYGIVAELQDENGKDGDDSPRSRLLKLSNRELRTLFALYNRVQKGE
jgi:hypothetical protein